jgi:hypothetical protein
MTQQTPMRVPTLAELHQENEDAFKQDQLKVLLNCPPPAQWIKTHKGTGIQYMPVDKVEYLLDRIFGRWRREIISIQQIQNAVVAVVRLHYFNPVTLEWDFHDGTGAMPIQVDAGSMASDLSKIKSGAIQMAAPAAASYALKDAADNLGKLFGRDITRKDTLTFDPAFKEDPSRQQVEEKAPPPPPPISQQVQFPANAFAAAATSTPSINTQIEF